MAMDEYFEIRKLLGAGQLPEKNEREIMKNLQSICPPEARHVAAFRVISHELHITEEVVRDRMFAMTLPSELSREDKRVIKNYNVLLDYQMTDPRAMGMIRLLEPVEQHSMPSKSGSMVTDYNTARRKSMKISISGYGSKEKPHLKLKITNGTIAQLQNEQDDERQKSNMLKNVFRRPSDTRLEARRPSRITLKSCFVKLFRMSKKKLSVLNANRMQAPRKSVTFDFSEPCLKLPYQKPGPLSKKKAMPLCKQLAQIQPVAAESSACAPHPKHQRLEKRCSSESLAKVDQILNDVIQNSRSPSPPNTQHLVSPPECNKPLEIHVPDQPMAVSAVGHQPLLVVQSSGTVTSNHHEHRPSLSSPKIQEFSIFDLTSTPKKPHKRPLIYEESYRRRLSSLTSDDERLTTAVVSSLLSPLPGERDSGSAFKKVKMVEGSHETKKHKKLKKVRSKTEEKGTSITPEKLKSHEKAKHKEKAKMKLIFGFSPSENSKHSNAEIEHQEEVSKPRNEEKSHDKVKKLHVDDTTQDKLGESRDTVLTHDDVNKSCDDTQTHYAFNKIRDDTNEKFGVVATSDAKSLEDSYNTALSFNIQFDSNNQINVSSHRNMFPYNSQSQQETSQLYSQETLNNSNNQEKVNNQQVNVNISEAMDSSIQPDSTTEEHVDMPLESNAKNHEKSNKETSGSKSKGTDTIIPNEKPCEEMLAPPVPLQKKKTWRKASDKDGRKKSTDGKQNGKVSVQNEKGVKNFRVPISYHTAAALARKVSAENIVMTEELKARRDSYHCHWDKTPERRKSGENNFGNHSIASVLEDKREQYYMRTERWYNGPANDVSSTPQPPWRRLSKHDFQMHLPPNIAPTPEYPPPGPGFYRSNSPRRFSFGASNFFGFPEMSAGPEKFSSELTTFNLISDAITQDASSPSGGTYPQHGVDFTMGNGSMPKPQAGRVDPDLYVNQNSSSESETNYSTTSMFIDDIGFYEVFAS